MPRVTRSPDDATPAPPAPVAAGEAVERRVSSTASPAVASVAPSASVGAPGAGAPSPAQVIGPESGRPWRFRFALLGVLAWWSLLGWMCRTTANPILISPPQWELTRVAVSGRVDRPDGVTVAETWRGAGLPERLRVINLDAVPGLLPDREYVWLLTPAGDGYEIVRTPGQETPPLVYPATPAVVAQMKRLAEEEAVLGDAALGEPDPPAK